MISTTQVVHIMDLLRGFRHHCSSFFCTHISKNIILSSSQRLFLFKPKGIFVALACLNDFAITERP